MNSNVLQFACQHCQSQLTVPIGLAGVTGPCPKCGQTITSPKASTPEPSAPAVAAAPTPGPGIWAAPPSPGLPQVPQLPNAPVNPQAQAWASLPARPPTTPQPLARPTSAFFDNPSSQPLDPALGGPAAQPPVVAAPPHVAYSQGPAAPPPMAQPNALAQAMQQMPPAQGMAGHSPNPALPLSRPATVGGSRLSLLARQLPQAEGTAPPLHLDSPPVALPPAGPKAAEAKNASMPRGLASSAKKRSSVFAILGKLTLLLLAAAAFLGWKFRGPIGDLALKYGQDWVQIAGLPAPEEAESSPVPGVDAIPSVTAKSSSSEKANKAVATADPQPLTAKPEVNASMHLPSISATPDAASPTVPATTEEVQKPATLASKGPEPEVRAVAAPAPKSDPPRAEPVQTAMNSTSTSTMPELVEVGRAKDDPKLIPESLTTTPHTSEVGRPIVKNVPPECLQALSALRGFLDATSWRERLKYIQLPGEMEAKAKEYYAKNPDGPVEVDEIEYYHHNTAPQVGKGMHVVFVLRSRAWQFPMGVPAMVEVHENEARVDWLTFVEFKDDLLNRFLKTYMEGPIRFHVGMRRTHYFEDDVPDIAGKHAFEIAPPMGNCHGYVFVPKDTPLARSLANTISWDKDLSLGVVELQWRREGGQKWIEMTALPQLNWYSQGASETSAASSAIAKPDAR